MDTQQHRPSPLHSQAPTFFQSSERIYIHKFAADLYVGNYILFKPGHCDNFMDENQSLEVGRIQDINIENSKITTQQFLHPSQLPASCKHDLPPLQHNHVRNMPEVVETSRTINITTSQVIRFAFLFPCTTITSPDSNFHPQGMIHYYILRFYYSEATKG